jgi:uncharacterized protein (TIGR02246 family)
MSNHIVLGSMLMLAASFISPGSANAENADISAIRDTLMQYGDALNSGDTAKVLPLYAPDGIFMPPFSESAIGIDAIKAAYDAVFKELKFDVKFQVAELVQMSPEWAYARTNSAGTTGHASTGKVGPEANQELFLFRKIDGNWKISRYSFSPTNPPF